jgi:hypothetical protein
MTKTFMGPQLRQLRRDHHSSADVAAAISMMVFGIEFQIVEHAV